MYNSTIGQTICSHNGHKPAWVDPEVTAKLLGSEEEVSGESRARWVSGVQSESCDHMVVWGAG